MLETKTLLVTGASGFLGQRVLKKLADLFDEITLLRRQPTDPTTRNLGHDFDLVVQETNFEQALSLISSGKISHILHMATNYGRRGSSLSEVLEANLMLPLGLVEAAAKHGNIVFINVDTVLPAGVSPYSTAKRQFREWLNFFSDRVAAVNLELEQFYGPNADESNFVTFVIRRLLAQDREIALTEGYQLRSMLYLDDLVDAMDTVLRHHIPLTNPGFENYQIGSPEKIRIRELVVRLAELCDNRETALKFGAVPYRRNEFMGTELDLSRIIALGWLPKHTLDQGLKKTVDSERKGIR